MNRNPGPVGFTWHTMPGLIHGTSRHGYTATLERHHPTSDWTADVYYDPDPVGHAVALPSRKAAEQAARDIATRDHNQRGPFP
jgi:hypothetical protein